MTTATEPTAAPAEETGIVFDPASFTVQPTDYDEIKARRAKFIETLRAKPVAQIRNALETDAGMCFVGVGRAIIDGRL